jgi:hypothetical protein
MFFSYLENPMKKINNLEAPSSDGVVWAYLSIGTHYLTTFPIQLNKKNISSLIQGNSGVT